MKHNWPAFLQGIVFGPLTPETLTGPSICKGGSFSGLQKPVLNDPRQAIASKFRRQLSQGAYPEMIIGRLNESATQSSQQPRVIWRPLLSCELQASGSEPPFILGFTGRGLKSVLLRSAQKCFLWPTASPRSSNCTSQPEGTKCSVLFCGKSSSKETLKQENGLGAKMLVGKQKS